MLVLAVDTTATTIKVRQAPSIGGQLSLKLWEVQLA
jgi:hypothetical protein